MTDEIDRLIQAGGGDDAFPLNDVEQAVWTRVDARQARHRLGRTQILALGLALMIGLTNGSLMVLAPRATPPEMHVFAMPTALASLDSPDTP